MPKDKFKKISLFIASILLSFLPALIGTFFMGDMAWYELLNKPSFNPPDWVFAPVWTLLYLLIGISFYLASKKSSLKTKIFFITQLGLNAIWTILFFGLHSPMLAFIDIILLWLFILLTLIEFYKISKAAGYILIPYLLWVSFALALNFSIVLLN